MGTDSLDEAFDALERMTVKVRSPDGTVRATCSLLTGIDVKFAPTVPCSHTESSLGEQVSQTFAGVRTAMGRGVVTMVTQVVASDADRSAADDERAAEYEAQVRKFEETVTSPRGMVKVTVRGQGEVSVRFRPGILNSLNASVEVLEQETVTALRLASERMEKRQRDAHSEHFDSDIH